jgi:hypothetical protein
MVLLSEHFGAHRDPDYYFGLGVGPGWNDIIYDLNKKLEAEKPDYKILQIKEKFAGLRFYTDELPYPAWDAIKEAEKRSFGTCEECGRPGKIWSSKSWIRTLCYIDYWVSEINKSLWYVQRRGLSAFFKTYFYIRRLERDRKRKESAKNGD